MQTILVVDDEPAIREVFKAILGAEGYRVITGSDATSALTLVQREKPDLLLLDVTLPGGASGFDICQKLREQGARLPILMVTARVTEAEKVIGLSLGADDYITKPFSNMEVVARVKAHLRQVGRHVAGPAAQDLLTVGNMVVDAKRREVLIDKEQPQLRHKEFELLHVLLNNIGLVLTREQLITKVWGDDFEGDDRVVDVHIFRLRDALKPFPTCPIDIQAVRSVGYRCALRGPAAQRKTGKLASQHAFALPDEPGALARQVVEYLREGLARGQAVCVFGRPALFDQVFAALDEAGLKPADLFTRKRLRHDERACLGSDGRFSASLFQEQCRAALAELAPEGRQGMAMVLDALALVGHPEGPHAGEEATALADLNAYERALDDLLTITPPPLVALCCLDLARLAGHDALSCLQRHPLVLQDQQLQVNSIYKQ